MPGPLPYRDFYYPLNVFMHILSIEEGCVQHLHYGLFEREGEPIGDAQERAAALLLATLPPPPAGVLDVGAGLGTTLTRLRQLGYDAEGVTPDPRQVAEIQSRHGEAVPVHCVRFEDFDAARGFDVIFFHESSQYIGSDDLFARAKGLASHLVVLDEFAFGSAEGLHRYDDFLAAAERHRFRLVGETDVSKQAAPSIEYFLQRLPLFRQRLITALGITSQQIDDLIRSGERYRDLYRSGEYRYRLLSFRADHPSDER